jgi:DNA-binding response OmpR family regulator
MGKKRILVIDDSPNFLEVIGAILLHTGYDVSLALDGEEGLKKARKERPDLVLLDVVMPGMDGYTLFKMFKSDSNLKNVPVIIVTGRPEVKELFDMEGDIELFVKPFDEDKLLARMKSLLEEAK